MKHRLRLSSAPVAASYRVHRSRLPTARHATCANVPEYLQPCITATARSRTEGTTVGKGIKSKTDLTRGLHRLPESSSLGLRTGSLPSLDTGPAALTSAASSSSPSRRHEDACRNCNNQRRKPRLHKLGQAHERSLPRKHIVSFQTEKKDVSAVHRSQRPEASSTRRLGCSGIGEAGIRPGASLELAAHWRLHPGSR